MEKSVKAGRARSRPLNRERVLEAALALADAEGLATVSMRKLARRLGVEAMSLYNHVANKEDLLDGMIDRVIGDIELPARGNWRTRMRERAISARRMLRAHPWAVGLLDSRSEPGAATLRHHDWVIGVLREGGFPLSMCAHAFALLDSFIYGFVLQEAALPASPSGEMTEVADSILAELPVETHPHLAEMIRGHVLKPGYEFGNSFEFGLDLILEGLERHRSAGAPDDH